MKEPQLYHPEFQNVDEKKPLLAVHEATHQVLEDRHSPSIVQGIHVKEVWDGQLEELTLLQVLGLQVSLAALSQTTGWSSATDCLSHSWFNWI
ncbi:hypothetical protein E2C01_074976 [Portunus trituberculatus]|uniref:Uncharacterized protein n=1 Tax=Portunus trituberculatus TaxID=210409 RepID=A0A5B7IHW6_PORTR|nr:hypothetical protein [Portunus trituberculatus]